MKIGYLILLFLTAFVVFLGAGRYRASADQRLESRILSDHQAILELQEKKRENCALVDNFPTSLVGICF